MFNFMKKGVGVGINERDREKSDRDDKEKRKREKKLRKEAKSAGIGGSGSGGISGSMSTEELLRLDEVRRSLKIRGRRKEKEKLPSGITADYSEFFAHLDIDRSSNIINNTTTTDGSSLSSGGIELDRGNNEEIIIATMLDHNIIRGNNNTELNMIINSTNNSGFSSHQNLSTLNNIYGGIPQSDSLEISIHSANNTKTNYVPLVPPKPPKRGILKGSRSSITSIHEDQQPQQPIITSPDSRGVLMRNTLQNELLFEAGCGGGESFNSVESLLSDGPTDGYLYSVSGNGFEREIRQRHGINSYNNLHVMTSPSPSAESLTDTTNSSFATPPFSMSPIGESQGIYRWGRVHAFEDIDLPLPQIELVKLPPPREFVIKRQKSPRNDFGFSLRKAICLDRSESLLSPTFKPVIFAEPGAGGGSTGLLPGDRLIKVNGTQVSELPRETIIEMIRNSGDSVRVEVQPVSELVELSRRCMLQDPKITTDEIDQATFNYNTLKRSASKRFKHETRHNDDITNGITNESGEIVWLVHRGGFTPAQRLQFQAGVETATTNNDISKIRIRLVHNGEELLVDEDDIEKANPSSLDLAEDICQLKHLNEASVLHCLRQRFASNLIHTKAGPILIVVNPMAPLSLYSEKVVSMFRGCKTEDMPPHIYSLAQTAYRAMLETRRDQSLIFMGRSGSGKTTSFKHALYYLSLAAGSVNKLLTAEKVNALNTILEAFGNTKTCLNSNATRFTQLLSLDFDHSGQIASASIQVLLLDRSRAGKRISNEHTFHILTRLLAGAEGMLQKELHLENISPEDNNPFVSLSQKLEDRHKAAAEFTRALQAFETLNIESSAVRGIWHILAAIYHLGVAGVIKIGTGPVSRIQFADPSAARKAASLLGVSLEDLLSAAFPSSITPGSSSPAKSPTETPESSWENLEGLVVGLYTEAMAAVVALINKSICTSAHTIASILLVDTPGFQNPASCGIQVGATLTDLRHNYLQERLQLLFHHMTLDAPKDRYAQELVEIESKGFPDAHPGPLVSLIDKAPQNHVVRTSQRDLREQDRRGLLWLLDEEAMYPNSNDETFLERLFSHYGDREHQNLIRRAAGTKQFVVQHLQGTNPVLYSANGWLKASREHPTVKNAATLLQDSTKDEINRLYVSSLTRGSGIVFCGSIAGLDRAQSLRRVSSIRRSFTSAGVKRNSVMLQVKFTVDGIIDTLRRTGTHFVHCYLLQHNAGTHSVVNSSPYNSIHGNDEMVNIPLLRSQFRGSQILEAARLHRLGFPESVPLSEFVRRFGLLGDVSSKDLTVEQILTTNEIDPTTYRIGPSQVLFRSGVLSQLEAKRDELLSDRIIQLQSYCRGYLARRRVLQRRVQELAVRCIQRNVRAFLAVRDWPWWRLLVRVTPLLNVHRTEEQLKIANDELQNLRIKLEKIENDRNLLKTDNDKLENKFEKSDLENSEASEFSSRSETVRNAIAAARIRTFGSEEDISNLRARSLQPSSHQSTFNLGTKSYTTEETNSKFDEESKQSLSGRSETVLNAIAAARTRTFGTDDLPYFRSNSVEPISMQSNLRNRPKSYYSELSNSSIGGTDPVMQMFRKSLTPTRSETVMNAIAAAKARTFGTDDISNSDIDRSSSLEPTSLQSNQNIHPKYNFAKTHDDSNRESEESTIKSKSEFAKNQNLTNENIRSNIESKSVFSKTFKPKLISSIVKEESELPGAGKPPKPPVPSHIRVARKPIKLLTNIIVDSKTSLQDDPTSPSITNPSNSSIINNNDSNKNILTNHQYRACSADVQLKLPFYSSTSNNRSETVTAAISAAKSRQFGIDTDDMTTKSIYPNNRTGGITSNSNGLYSRESSVVRLTSRSPSPVSAISTISGYNNGSSRINNHLPPKRPINNNNYIRSTRSASRSSSIQPQQQNNRATTPHRIFPQSYTPDLDIFELHQMEQSPVIFDANLSFVMGCNKQSVKQNFHPSPSHQNPQTASNHLSDKISNFLKRTDHVMDEWKTVGKRNSICCGDDTISLIERQRERSIERGESRLGRSKSSTNILIKGFQLAKNLPRTPRSRSSSIARDISSLDDDDRTIYEDELSEMTVDLEEERSTSNIASERLEAETGERLKLEKELQEQQNKVKNLQETSEKLEMELICAKSDLNGISEDEDGENDDTAGGVYKLKYERVARELEFTKRRLQTQHEHDLEQLVGLKKQLEKKLADAYEEVEEQRQVVGQWKRKSQKMTNEQNDLRMLLEEQNGRNNLLEKKQRKFDLECQALQDATRQERQAKDRLAREKDVLIAEKFTLEQNLADTHLELELKEEKVTALQRELEEMTFDGGTEEEVAQLRRSKMDMDRRLKEQEEELDEMAGQVQLLEQAKLRLEMTVETMRKEARRETQQRDDELEEARGSAYKKIKALECQLETEHEERTLLLREKHELERRLQTNEELERADRQAEEAANQKLRRDLRKYKALLKDAHAQLERLKADSPGKALIRQLRNQLEDAETARTISMKARQTAESELSEIQTQLDEAQRGKNEAEEKANSSHRDRAELQAQIEENEEEMAELMKKYTTTVKQLNNEQSALSEYEIKISELEAEKNSLKENIAELQARLENVENMSDPTAAVQSKRLELRAKELESRLELEQATKARLEVQSNRHKDALEKIQQEVTQSKMREMTAQDALKKLQKTLRELREEFHTISSREQESLNRRRDLEKKMETLEAEAASLRNDLRLALQRIADLQQAMEEGDDDATESESDSTDGSISDLEERLKPIQVKRTSINTNGVSDTKLVLKGNTENSPRITVTSPSTANITGDNLKNGDSSFA